MASRRSAYVGVVSGYGLPMSYDGYLVGLGLMVQRACRGCPALTGALLTLSMFTNPCTLLFRRMAVVVEMIMYFTFPELGASKIPYFRGCEAVVGGWIRSMLY